MSDYSSGIRLEQGLRALAGEDGAIRVESIRRLDVKPGETLVVRAAKRVNQQIAADIRRLIEPHLPQGVGVLVLGPDFDLEVVSASNPE
jgi:hypothetical protein